MSDIIHKNMIDEPQHYIYSNFEVKDVVKTLVNENEIHGISCHYYANALEYLMRFKRKNGIEDLKKCQKYIDYLIKEESEKNEL